MQFKVPLYISFLFVTLKFQTWNMVNYDHGQNTVRTWSEHGQNKVNIKKSESSDRPELTMFQTWNTVNSEHGQNTVRTRSK